MSEKESHCTECGADYTADQECQCSIVAAEMDPARELDAVEVLISVAKKAMRIIDAANEEEEGPMAMPVPVAEDLREAIYDLEDIWSLIPYDMLTMLRLEMYTAHFNARAARDDGVEDLPAYFDDLDEKEGFGRMKIRQEDGIEIDPMDDDGNIGAADPDMLKKFTADSQEDLAAKSLEFLMRHNKPIEAGQQVGMTIKEVIGRYNPDVQVRCPHKDDCGEVDFGEYKTCPHSDYHRVTIDCFAPCPFHKEYVNCMPMEELSNEETID